MAIGSRGSGMRNLFSAKPVMRMENSIVFDYDSAQIEQTSPK